MTSSWSKYLICLLSFDARSVSKISTVDAKSTSNHEELDFHFFFVYLDSWLRVFFVVGRLVVEPLLAKARCVLMWHLEFYDKQTAQGSRPY